MDSFITHTGVGVPLRRSNVDTDQIIPARYLKRVSRTGFDDGLFAGWREDPAFVLNRAEYRPGSVLVAGPDFGTGSSREHAVWALQDYGFRVVTSPKFADIFRTNSGKAGLVAAQITLEDTHMLWKLLENSPGAAVEVDLRERTISCEGFAARFDIDDYTRWRLLEGLDDIDVTLRNEDAIAAFEAARPSFKPRTLPALTLPKEKVVSARAVDLGMPALRRA